MLTPYLPSHLRRTAYGVFHFRIVLPPHLAAVAGKKEVWRSLRTRDPERAKLLAYLLNARFAMLKKPALADLLTLSPDDIQQLTIHGLHVERGQFRAERIELDDTTPETLQRDQAVLKDLIAPFTLPPAEPTDKELADLEELAAMRAATKTKRLSECVRLYLDSKQGEISPASMKDYTNGLATFLRWAGDETPIGMCTWDFMRGYFEFLQWLPTNYEKRRDRDFQGQEARHFVAKAQARNERPSDVISDQTRRQQRLILSGFFTWAIEARQFKRENPTVGQVKMSKTQRLKSNAGRGYLPFPPDALRQIFEPARFLAFAQNPEDFFLPLLGLYTGARMNELAQARVQDIRQGDAGRWFLDIQPDHTGDDETETRVKTISSIRSAPIHPDLIRLGLIAYALELGDRGAVRLFPHLPRDAKGKHTKNPSRRFGDYLTTLGIKDSRRHAFPSFRTTLIRRLKGAGVAKDARMELVGHAPRDVHDRDYAGQFGDEFLAKQTLDRVQFDEVNPEALSTDLSERLSRFLTIALRGARKARPARG